MRVVRRCFGLIAVAAALGSGCGLVGAPDLDEGKVQRALDQLPALEASVVEAGCRYESQEALDPRGQPGVKWDLNCSPAEAGTPERERARRALAAFVEASVLAAQSPKLSSPERDRIVIKLRLASYRLGKWESKTGPAEL